MTKREREIDIIKGIGILFMVMGHIEYGLYFDKFIHAFHIPLFFLVSGFLYKKIQEHYGKWILKKMRSILIPYLFFGSFFLLLAVAQVIFHLKSVTELINHAMHFVFVNTEGLAIAGAIWYLTAIFFVEMIYFIIDHLKLSEALKTVVVIACFLCGTLLGWYGIRLPWAIDVALVGILFFHVGKNALCFKSRLENMNTYLTGVIFCVALICMCANSIVNMRLGEYGNPALFVVGAITMMTFLYFVAYKFKNHRGYIISELDFIGVNSIVYLCLNEFVLFFLKCFLVIIQGSYLLEYAIRIAILFIVLCILHLSSVIFERTSLFYVIGRNKAKLIK